MRAFLLGGLLVVVGILQICAGVKFLLTVPKEAYYDANLVASVSAFGLEANQKESVTLEYKGQKDTSKVLNSTVLEFTSDGSQIWSVLFTWEYIQQMDETGVLLVMSCNHYVEQKAISFTQNFGYIFIQTDKPVYTPLQTVKYRVIAVDEYQKLAKYIIRIDIKNHKLVVVDRMRVTAEEAFKAKEFELPKDTPPGEWTITANYEGVDHAAAAYHVARFEVKEYVLPRFSSTISVDPNVVTKGTHWINVNVTSRYVYGEPVLGTIVLKLGLWEHTGITMFNVSYTEQLTDGQFSKNIAVRHLFPDSFPWSRNNRLYVKAVVTESASQESYTYEDTSTFVAHPYYLVEFKMSKKYFKPGFPYTLQAQVFAQNGRRASWVVLNVQTEFFNNNNQPIGAGTWIQHDLDGNGEMIRDFDVPEDVYIINFTAVVTDPKVLEYETHKLEVRRYMSPNNEYIHLSLATPIRRYQDGLVLLRYTKPKQSTFTFNSMITILVLAKGHIIFTNTTVRNANGLTYLRLPSRLYTEISPNMRIVAYYHVDSHVLEFIVDSMFVDTPDVCLEEVSLRKVGDYAEYKPKDTFLLKVDGSPDMNVGFVAVDKAVFVVNDKPTLTRKSMFAELGSHDRGLESGDGSTVDEILENSGLVHMFLNVGNRIFLIQSGETLNEEVATGSVKEPALKPEQGAKKMPTDAQEKSAVVALAVAEQPPQTVRNYFPESWFFEERKLPKNGMMDLNLTLPDSITTWQFLAVGVSSNRGICVSDPFEQKVLKLFFADVNLPYKATRLEEVKARIAVYNYHIHAVEVSVMVTGSEGLCFSANTYRGSTQNSANFTLRIEPGQAKGEIVKVIPLRNGDLTLRVEIQSQHETDIVEKKLHVIAEGQRVRKSITFVLDPEAKHATFRPSKKNRTTLCDSATINNVFDLKNKEQQTTIDLALPSNAIRGTEFCRISAFGDLMGDIITRAVIESRNLIDTPMLDAEEALSNLAPTVHALISAKRLGLMDKTLQQKARKFVTRWITTLLKYRQDTNSFALTPQSKPSTWLTAFILRTLCHANSLAFIDKENLIDGGFDWLLRQIESDRSMKEQDSRYLKNFVENKIMLNAEVLIAVLECQKSYMETHLFLQGVTWFYLESNLGKIKDAKVLAATTYALMLFVPTSEEFEAAVRRLINTKRVNKYGHIYWSDREENKESKRIPLWFYKEPDASAIEATAYALMVFLKYGGLNVDSIADWLVGKRNYNGAFIGAVDSAVAIQALSEYSLQKHRQEVDLHCNITSDKLKDSLFSFEFTDENAILRKSLHNLPVGQVIDVVTKGQGLGQMQVQVEYNVPINKNQNCPFQVVVSVKRTMVRLSDNMFSNPLCTSCDIGCPKPQAAPVLDELPATRKVGAQMTVKVYNAKKMKGDRKIRTKKPKVKVTRPPRRRTTKRVKRRNTTKKPATTNKSQNIQQARDVGASFTPVASKKSICIHVCLQHLQFGASQPVEVRIEMLTGYQPVKTDIDMIKNQTYVRHVEYDDLQAVLRVQFLEIPCTEQICVAFRAVDDGGAERLTPANVEVIQIGSADAQCVMEYHGLEDDESLQVYCANFTHINRGECRCYSGLCSSCRPVTMLDLQQMSDVRELACNKAVAYQLQVANITDMDSWVQLNARVISVNKTGTDNVTPGSIIKLISPTSCQCPVHYYGNGRDKVYMLSADVERLVDSDGNNVYLYLLDEQSLFLRVADPGVTSTLIPAVDHYYLSDALKPSNVCPK